MGTAKILLLVVCSLSIRCSYGNEDEVIDKRFKDMEHKFSLLLKDHISLTKRLDKVEKHNEKLQTIVNTLQKDNGKLEKQFLKFQNDSFRKCKERINKTDKPSSEPTLSVSKSDNILNGNSTSSVHAPQGGLSKSMVQSVKRISAQKRLLLPVTTGPHSTPMVPTQARVAFFARMSNDLLNPGDNQHIEFSNVITNVGNAYISTTSTFLCPIAGVYVFSVTILGEPNKFLEAEIVRNGNIVAYIYTYDDNRYETGSHLVVLDLQQNDTVWVRVHGVHHHTGTVADGPFSSFSGFILWSY